ncbi:hypothetical protein TG4357_02222 [Thalassovita gelatinovora]|uniref:DUF6455 domain-containing protein n=1 Tax=Thalassovita gelatinovora TaxID=53501 RepID=A0A0P1FD01_THAGE|nr:DUF6455 family protein [Thalassovita gelatinovora]QIZ80570.1 hypothetical protein HFZ77_08775 [Thalassovita gelatinovora]CUH66078.1 hypothetical protein TG4357_02222 [Thalassovita gelatinovora]SEQ76487.1 hypothetical protein SAMN04488043_108171 [Thalassovita gelatinovora]
MGIVTPLGDPVFHFWLTRSVARSVGVNLSDAMNAGQLDPQGYVEMVTRCRQCRFVSQCEQWLAVTGAGADRVPEMCVNEDKLNALIAPKRATEREQENHGYF